MNQALFQQLHQQLAEAKREFTNSASKLAIAEQAFKNMGGDPNSVDASPQTEKVHQLNEVTPNDLMRANALEALESQGLQLASETEQKIAQNAYVLREAAFKQGVI